MKLLNKYLAQLKTTLAQHWQRRHQSDLEQYVSNQYPKNTADVEYWTRKYHTKTMRGFV